MFIKNTFTHKLTTDSLLATLRRHLYFFILTVTEWNAQDCGISKAVKDTSILPSKIVQMKASQETSPGAVVA